MMGEQNLGMVSTRWLLIADRHPQGIFSNDCKILSKLCSRSVDFAKSGNPVEYVMADEAAD
jgi:hypothetical protein